MPSLGELLSGLVPPSINANQAYPLAGPLAQVNAPPQGRPQTIPASPAMNGAAAAVQNPQANVAAIQAPAIETPASAPNPSQEQPVPSQEPQANPEDVKSWKDRLNNLSQNPELMAGLLATGIGLLSGQGAGALGTGFRAAGAVSTIRTKEEERQAEQKDKEVGRALQQQQMDLLNQKMQQSIAGGDPVNVTDPVTGKMVRGLQKSDGTIQIPGPDGALVDAPSNFVVSNAFSPQVAAAQALDEKQFSETVRSHQANEAIAQQNALKTNPKYREFVGADGPKCSFAGGRRG